MATTPSVTREPFGTTREGAPVDRYTLESAAGVAVAVITYGAGDPAALGTGP